MTVSAIREDVDLQKVLAADRNDSVSIDTVSFDPPVGLTCAVDVFDRTELFDLIDNSRVAELSSLGGRSGFSSHEAVRKSTGISVRRILRPGVTVTHLAQAVFDKLERATGFAPGDFGAIFLCHSGTDPTACEREATAIETAVGLPAGTLQPFNHGCSGFLKLLHSGCLKLDADRTASPVALVSIETPEVWHDAADRLFCGIVSAGATAVVLEAGRGLPVSVIHADNYRIPADRRLNADPLFQRETTDVFCFRGQPCHRTVMRMNAEPVFLNGIELMLEQLREAVALLPDSPHQRRIAIPHQPSGKLLRALIAAASNEFPTVEFLNNLDLYGNTISSTIPTVLARLPEVLQANDRPPLKDGDHLILLGAGICMEEIETHMAAGFACIQWQTAACATNATTTAALRTQI
ncbi:MAG: hypothetical protein KDA96_16305 [Planctomycetaceae bacterium]|nr:hypothetical protein [Planctomycetaceae bacterium]